MPSHLIHAMVYTHAEDNIVVLDDGARFITGPEIRKNGSEELATLVEEANGILAHGHQVANKLDTKDKLKFPPVFF